MNPSKQSLEDTCRTVLQEQGTIYTNGLCEDYWIVKAINRCRQDGVPEKEITAIVNRYRFKKTLQDNQ